MGGECGGLGRGIFHLIRRQDAERSRISIALLLLHVTILVSVEHMSSRRGWDI